jgi:hypothetical protein
MRDGKSLALDLRSPEQRLAHRRPARIDLAHLDLHVSKLDALSDRERGVREVAAQAVDQRRQPAVRSLQLLAALAAARHAEPAASRAEHANVRAGQSGARASG